MLEIKTKLMKKYVFMAVGVLSTVFAFSQVQIVQLPTSPFSFTLTDWQRFTVLNPSDKAEEVLLFGELKQGQGGKVLASFTSSKVVLNAGMNTFTEASLRLADLNFTESQTGASMRAGRSLPAGSYVACIQVKAENGTILGTSCREVGLTPFSPPLLVHPANGGSIAEKQPLFSWMPVVMEGGNSEVEYELSLYEIREDQNKTEAIARNRPIYRDRVLGISQLVYPTTGRNLKEHINYVWQVKAYYKGYYLGASELFRFNIGAGLSTEKVSDTLYIQLDPHKIQAMQACGAVLKVSCKHYVPNEEVQVLLQERTGEKHSLSTGQYRREEDSGLIFINLSELDFVEDGERYCLQLKRQNNQELMAHIEYSVR